MICLLAASARADQPVVDTGEHGGSASDTEKRGTIDKEANAAIDRIASTGATWQKQVRRVVQTDTSLGQKAVVSLAEALARDELRDGVSSQQRINVCLYVLQLLPVEGSVAVLDKLSMSKSAGDSIRVEALVAMCNQRQGIDAVKRKLAADDDRTRAAAVRALTRAQSNDEISNMLSDLRQRKTDFTGTSTGTAMGEAQSVLDLSRVLSPMSLDDQLTYLLANLPYEQPPPPAPAQLGRDPVSIFKWNRLVFLWKEDPLQVRRVAEKYKKTNPERGRLVDLLLRDLTQVD
jgi:hypothetical protein